MKNYTSNTYYLLDYIFYLIFFSAIVGLITYFLKDNRHILIGSAVLLSIFILVIFRLISKLAIIEFNAKDVRIRYRFPRKEVRINYSSLNEIVHITGYNISSINILKYKQLNEFKKLKITAVVSSNEYLEFVKWVKKKDENIEFNFHPVDSELRSEFLEKYK